MASSLKYITGFFLLLTQVIVAQDFELANKHYRDGKFDAAVTEYEKIIQSGKESDELYFNLANSYYKLAKVGPAIYYYEKALLLDPNDKDVQNNLKFAQKMQIDEIKELPGSGVNNALSRFTGMFHHDSWAWITVASAFAFLLAFIGYYFIGATLYKRILFVAMFVMLLLMCISIASAWHQKRTTDGERPAIVYAEIAGVKAEPTSDANDAFILHEGAKVYVIESLDNWRHISLADGNDGWIDAKAIRELK